MKKLIASNFLKISKQILEANYRETVFRVGRNEGFFPQAVEVISIITFSS